MDLAIQETGDGGDVIFKGGDLVMTNGIFNMVYLALFGGNIEQTTSEANDPSGDKKQRFDWWGNSVVFQDQSERQMNSLFERSLVDTTLTSAGISRLEEIAKQDLAFLSDYAQVSVSISLEGHNRASIEVVLIEPESTAQSSLRLLWNGTKLEQIKEETI